MEAHPYTSAPADSPWLETLPVQPLLTSEFDADPGAVYGRLRRTYGPVAPVGLMGVPVWLVLDYREVLDVLPQRGARAGRHDRDGGGGTRLRPLRQGRS